MGLLSSIFKRQAAPPRAAAGGVGESVDEVQRARTRARQRLIGAAVLLGIGVVGFPLVFETQPRPIPVNIPIELPRKEGAPALTMPAARPPAAPASIAASAAPTAATPAAVGSTAIITESRADAGREVEASPPSPARAASKPAAKPAEVKPEAKPAETKPAEAKPAETKPAKATDAARARALLEGQTETAADAGRFVVQVGAFADAAAARETRQKVEHLGLKTYTQVAETASGKRIRVRAGPYASRAEAEKALAKARAAGLTAVVLTL